MIPIFSIDIKRLLTLIAKENKTQNNKIKKKRIAADN